MQAAQLVDAVPGLQVLTLQGLGEPLLAPDLLRMIEYLMTTYNLDRQHAYTLCSVQGDLKISEIVDGPNWIVSTYIPRDIFPTAH